MNTNQLIQVLMRTFLFIFFFCIYSQALWASLSVAQGLQQKVSITFADENLAIALSKFRTAVPVQFAYDNSRLNLANYHVKKRVFKETDARDILLYLLKNTDIQYKESTAGIVLLPKAQPQKLGRITGRVVDSETNEPLQHATVQIKGSSAVTVADLRGYFRLNNVRLGKVTLIIRYLGYAEQIVNTQVMGDHTATVNVALVAQLNELEGITVEGIRRGEVKSLNTMKTADNIKYVLSQEQIERFPDNTVGEALQRVPGVAVEYSYGLANGVIIRGLDQSQGSITLNGNRLPSTSAGYRTTDLNGILSSTVEAIEVIKTLTPDQDADGTAGTVNIITKTPPEDSQSLDTKVSFGNNRLLSKNMYEVGLNYAQRQNRWGYQVGGSYMRSLRGEDRIEKGYDDFIIGETTYKNRLSVIALEDTQLKRDNLGVQAELNFYPNNESAYYLRGNYNKYYEIQARNNRNFIIGEYQSATALADVTVEHAGNDRDYHRDLLMLSLGGKKAFYNWEINGDLTYSRGMYDQPIYYNANFKRGGFNGTLDNTAPKTPSIALLGSNIYDPTTYTTNQYVNRHDQALDHDGQLTVNAIRAIRFNERDKGIIKFGGRLRYKYNERTRNYFRHVLKEGAFALNDFNTGIIRDDYYQDRYNIGMFPDVDKMQHYFLANPGLFIDDETYTRQNTDPDSYNGNEYLIAAYAMTRFNIDKLEVTTGLRYEQTGFEYQGNELILDENGAYVGTNAVNTDRTFDGFFPSINLKYALSPHTNIRAAATRSLSRPAYYDLVPWEEVLNRNKRINKGNPDLNQSTATNLDLLFEHYLKKMGLLSAGVFYKRIQNYIYERSYQQVGGQYDGWRIDQATNGAAADVYGFEVAWQQQLTFLPGFLNGFGIYANYTQIQSRFEVPGIEVNRTVRLPEMRPKVGNVALSYEKYGFSGRISAYFYETFTMELADTPSDDLIESGRIQLDFSAAQQINPKTTVFLGVSNLTNAPVRSYYGDERPDNDRIYAVWGNIGVRFKPF